ncbi:MAG: ADP-ribosylglycohydrolase family protein [Pseudomonadota bacterium]
MGRSADMFDRACGALAGVALGDALGMPSQTLTRAEIRAHYGRIAGFVAPIDDHPVSHGLNAAQVTDDTEQTLLLAARLVSGQGEIDNDSWARDLLDWESDVQARGLRDLLGPSSKAALEDLLSGTPATETGRAGTTNGAAMRIAPVGIATPSTPLLPLIDRVEDACRLTHNTGDAIAAASAVAAMISSGLEGMDFDAALAVAIAAAAEGQRRGHTIAAHDIGELVSQAVRIADANVSEETLAREIGTTVASHHSVPAAFGVVRLAGADPWKSGLIAANIGDDTDTIGAIACAMAGACSGLSAFPQEAVTALFEANSLSIDTTARSLLELRGTVVSRRHLAEERAI